MISKEECKKSGFKLVGLGRMNLSCLKPGEREDNADHHDGHVETDGLPVGVGDLADNIENGANKADPHDHL